jgi:hypothetical protein
MAILKQYWRIITFALVCLLSVGMGAWAYMGGSEVSDRMAAVDRLRNAVEGAGRSPANMSVIEAKKKTIEQANAEFEASMNAALDLQSTNPFYERIGPDGKVITYPRKPLLPSDEYPNAVVLPEPGSNADAISFRTAYETAFAQLTQRLRARDKATAEEVSDYFERWFALQQGATAGNTWRPWGPRKQQSQAEDDSKKNLPRPDVIRQYPRTRLAEDIARSIYMYVDNSAFGRHIILQKTDVPTAIDIWQAQMSLWIQQDMVAAMARCNEARAEELKKAGHPDRAWVGNMPVKRLRKMTIESRLGKGGGSNPITFTGSFTTINNDDRRFMVPIALELIIEEAALPKLLEEICRVGFYTPYNVKYEIVKPNPIQDDYIYGDDPVLSVVIEIEGYYFRKVFEQWIPKALKDILKNPDARDPTDN